jgi:hypothetical protein
MVLFSAVAAWCFFLGAAMVLGGVRDRLMAQRLGEETARRLLTLVLCAIIFLTTWGMVCATGLRDPSAAWRIGAGWTVATLAPGDRHGPLCHEAVRLGDPYGLQNLAGQVVAVGSRLDAFGPGADPGPGRLGPQQGGIRRLSPAGKWC